MCWLLEMLDRGGDRRLVASNARAVTNCGWILFAVLVMARLVLGPH